MFFITFAKLFEISLITSSYLNYLLLAKYFNQLSITYSYIL